MEFKLHVQKMMKTHLNRCDYSLFRLWLIICWEGFLIDCC